jgi:ABC-type transporter Mla subunit MlaD
MSDEGGAQIEFAGMSLTGSKMLLLVPILGSLGGALWGGFEVYQRLLDAEEAITTYGAPDMSGINQQLAVQAESITALQKDVAQQFQTVTTLLNSAREDIDDIRTDIDKLDTFVRNIDESTNTTQRDLRNDVYTMESTLNDRMREIDNQIKSVEEELDKKIQQILENPLSEEE